jgi:hypothetical protein
MGSLGLAWSKGAQECCEVKSPCTKQVDNHAAISLVLFNEHGFIVYENMFIWNHDWQGKW